jgi:hypothetical protein
MPSMESEWKLDDLELDHLVLGRILCVMLARRQLLDTIMDP